MISTNISSAQLCYIKINSISINAEYFSFIKIWGGSSVYVRITLFCVKVEIIIQLVSTETSQIATRTEYFQIIHKCVVMETQRLQTQLLSKLMFSRNSRILLNPSVIGAKLQYIPKILSFFLRRQKILNIQ